MKKLISCLLVALMIVSLTASAFAVGSVSPVVEGGGGGAPVEDEVTIIPADSPELTEEEKEGSSAATEALDGIADLKSDVEGVADVAGEDEIKAGGLYYVKADWFPAPFTFSDDQAKGLLGVLFFGKDGHATPTFTKANGAKVLFPAEGWYCNLYGAVKSPG